MILRQFVALLIKLHGFVCLIRRAESWFTFDGSEIANKGQMSRSKGRSHVCVKFCAINLDMCGFRTDVEPSSYCIIPKFST